MKRHLIGIGGVGMSALATALLRQGDVVTGADRNLTTPNIAFLKSRGVKVFPDDGSGVDDATDEVIVSTAIESDNPGLVRAENLKIAVTHRAKALSRTLKDYKLIAVVGTCGKSTVTAMLGHILAQCGLDPFCVNGANVPGWEGAVRFGRGEYAVAEVDESDKSLVAFSPYAAIVTNASADHYSKEEMDEVFDAFVKNLPGPLVDGRKGIPLADDPRLQTLPLMGEHNRANAALAIAMAEKIGLSREKAFEAMQSFRGVERRLQCVGKFVYDDYAHNPEKLKAMASALQERAKRGLCIIWRPHGYAPLRKMLDALATMFAQTLRPQDRLILLPVYDAGGTTDRSINSDALLEKLKASPVGTCVELAADLDAAYAKSSVHREACDLFVTSGARDPELPALAKRLAVMTESYPVARTFAARARGLIGRKTLGPGEGLLIPRCNAIHTFFMRFPIDATFLDGENRIVRTVRNIPPGRFFVWGGWKARKVLETAATI